MVDLFAKLIVSVLYVLFSSSTVSLVFLIVSLTIIFPFFQKWETMIRKAKELFAAARSSSAESAMVEISTLSRQPSSLYDEDADGEVDVECPSRTSYMVLCPLKSPRGGSTRGSSLNQSHR